VSESGGRAGASRRIATYPLTDQGTLLAHWGSTTDKSVIMLQNREHDSSLPNPGLVYSSALTTME